jgi:hypothetical protein
MHSRSLRVAVAAALVLAGISLLRTDARAGGPPVYALSRRPHSTPPPPPPPLDRQNVVHLKFGTYDPEGPENGGAYFGLLTGVEFQNRVTIGFDLDVYRRSYSRETVIAETVDPTGNVITTTATSLATASTLIPLGVSLGIRLPGSRTLTPYVGGAVAYEILVNEVRNYELGVEATDVYGGPGWQVFGGLICPLTREVRVLGELGYNDAMVRRDIDHYALGLPVGERIDVSGISARAGIEFHFD